MTISDKNLLFRRVFVNADGEAVLDILKEELGYNSRTQLREDDRKQCYWAGRASVVQYILDMINTEKKANRKHGKSRQ